MTLTSWHVNMTRYYCDIWLSIYLNYCAKKMWLTSNKHHTELCLISRLYFGKATWNYNETIDTGTYLPIPIGLFTINFKFKSYLIIPTPFNIGISVTTARVTAMTVRVVREPHLVSLLLLLLLLVPFRCQVMTWGVLRSVPPGADGGSAPPLHPSPPRWPAEVDWHGADRGHLPWLHEQKRAQGLNG